MGPVNLRAHAPERGLTMGAGHKETSRGPAGTAAGRHSNGLKWALAMTSTFMVVEVVGGFWTGSLALIADAAHMLCNAPRSMLTG